MLRPIDTQTIYQQSQEISNRQQAYKQGEEMQQVQFAHLMQKETREKKEAVSEIEHNEKIKNDLNKERKKGKEKSKGQHKKDKKAMDVKKEKAPTPLTHFDARI